ncbi:NHLP leader peptide family RiPP precursor [Nostoc sp. FACHB-888]|uniref:NHLP leader peptide family RiPP precursor n=1 Tax=Nostoc sp. FACHB-888 TaxID=2692842 RepID=UPI0016836B2B|nr:NHLP leader peptide family RiPP precursor [Nostoc sp. FACHB-888]MBD2243790.1 NHLP leader peptide family natural product precursor [Nostoc sp. FACHB-888]
MSEQSTPRTRKDIEAHIIAQSWKDEAYKQELLSNSKAVIEREFGIQLPANVSVKVVEENPTNLYFVLPMRPDLSGAELSDEQLETVAGGILPAASALVSATISYLAGENS